MRLLLTLFLFMLLCGVPGAHAAPCLKSDCSQDPQAWADMLGNTPKERAEQKIAREAAQNEVNREHARDVAAMPLYQKERMVFAMEDSLSRLTGERFHVLSALVVPRGTEYVFCGMGEIVGPPLVRSVFVVDTREGGIKTLHATRREFEAAGCADKMAVALR